MKIHLQFIIIVALAFQLTDSFGQGIELITTSNQFYKIDSEKLVEFKGASIFCETDCESFLYSVIDSLPGIETINIVGGSCDYVIEETGERPCHKLVGFPEKLLSGFSFRAVSIMNHWFFEIPEHLETEPSLEVLNLTYTPIQRLHYKHLKNIKCLILDFTQIQEIPEKLLEDNKLRYLSLQGVAFSEEYKRYLTQKLPHCEIVF